MFRFKYILTLAIALGEGKLMARYGNPRSDTLARLVVSTDGQILGKGVPELPGDVKVYWLGVSLADVIRRSSNRVFPRWNLYVEV